MKYYKVLKSLTESTLFDIELIGLGFIRIGILSVLNQAAQTVQKTEIRNDDTLEQIDQTVQCSGRKLFDGELLLIFHMKTKQVEFLSQ